MTRGKNTKEPLSDEDQDLILRKAREIGTYFGVDVERTVLMLMETGIHISVLARPEDHRVRFFINNKGHPEMRWYRPKKKGADADTRVILSPRTKEWAEEYMLGKRPRYTEFYWRMLKELGENAGMKDLSQMTFRHTFAVNMLRRGVPESTIKDILNCSEKTLRRYVRYREETIDDVLIEKMGWG